MSVRSHIQMPKCVLKRFENENHELFFFNKNDYKKIAPIKIGHAKTLNRELGYYSSDVEEILNNKIETPLGRVLASVERNDFNSKNINIPIDSEIIIKNYAYSLLCRSEQILKTLHQELVYFQFFDNEYQHDFAVKSGLECAIRSNFLKNWQLSFVLNNTEYPFVLPLYGLFSFCDRKHQYIQMPLTPKISAALTYRNHLEKYLLKRFLPIVKVFDEYQIFNINQIGCQYELTNNRGICISNDKEYLKEIISNVYHM